MLATALNMRDIQAMQTDWIRRHLSALAVSTVLVFVGVVGFGIVSMGPMPVAGAATCVMEGHERAMCPMSAADHLRIWQSAFQAVPAKTALPILSLLALAVAAAWTVLGLPAVSVAAGYPRQNAPPGTGNPYMRMLAEGRARRITYG